MFGILICRERLQELRQLLAGIVCVCVCVRACVCACVRACVRAYMHAYMIVTIAKHLLVGLMSYDLMLPCRLRDNLMKITNCEYVTLARTYFCFVFDVLLLLNCSLCVYNK